VHERVELDEADAEPRGERAAERRLAVAARGRDDGDASQRRSAALVAPLTL
jgi:hypothetical protein